MYTHASETRLNQKEKDALRTRILTYMEYHPRQYTARKKHTVPVFSFISHMSASLRAVSAFGAVAAITLTLVPYFAEGAKPGDLLYAIKTGVNEPLRSITLSTPAEKITFETKLLERRVEEAKLLIEEGKLDAAAEEKLSVNIKRHTDTIQKNIEELKTTDTENADVAQTEFTSVLATSDTIVSALTNDDDQAATSTLKQAVADARNDAEEKATSTSPLARERILGRIEQELARAYELHTSIATNLTTDEESEVGRRFAAIENILRAPVTATDTAPLALQIATVAETPASSTATSTPIEEPKVTHDYEVLTQVKTLIVYLTDASMRAKLPKEQGGEPVPDAAPPLATSTPAVATSTATSTPDSE